MIFRDTTGAVIDRGNRVSFPLGLGQSAQGVVVETHGGLGLDGTPQSQPVVVLSVNVVLPADRNGIIAGLVRLPEPAQVPEPSSVVTE